MSLQLFTKYQELLHENDWRNYLPKHPGNLYEPLEYLMSLGGKRLRPIAVLLACDIVEGNVKKAIPAAWAIEMFHNFTLAHDDIMDHASTRRGLASVHRKFGMEQAIISGDALMILAYQALESYETGLFKRLISVFSKAAIDVCEGQQLDMDFETLFKVEYERYLKMIKGKTSALLAASLQIGALIGGATENESQKLYEVGEKVGVAFQIKDDWLDAFGDEQKVGKKRGGDFLQRKKSIPWILAFENANTDQKKILTTWLQRKDDVSIDDVYQIMSSLHIAEKTNEMATQHLQNVKSIIHSLSVVHEKKSTLLNWCDLLVNRSF